MDYNSTIEVLGNAALLMSYVCALTIAVMQIVKQFKIAKRFLPIIAIIIAIVITFLFVPQFSVSIVLIGFVSGLTSMGLFTGIKNTVSKGL